MEIIIPRSQLDQGGRPSFLISEIALETVLFNECFELRLIIVQILFNTVILELQMIYKFCSENRTSSKVLKTL